MQQVVQLNNYRPIFCLFSKSRTRDNTTRYECHFINYESDEPLNTETLTVVFEAEGIITPGENLTLSGEYTPDIKHRYHCVIVPCRKRFL